MRFTAAIATLAILIAPSVFAQTTTISEASTTTITRTVVEATATSTIARSSSSALSTSTYTKPSITGTASPSAGTVSSEFMGAASTQHGSIFVVVLAGAAVIALGL